MMISLGETQLEAHVVVPEVYRPVYGVPIAHEQPTLIQPVYPDPNRELRAALTVLQYRLSLCAPGVTGGQNAPCAAAAMNAVAEQHREMIRGLYPKLVAGGLDEVRHFVGSYGVKVAWDSTGMLVFSPVAEASIGTPPVVPAVVPHVVQDVVIDACPDCILGMKPITLAMAAAGVGVVAYLVWGRK